MQTGDYVQTGETGKDTLFRLIGTQGTLDFYGWEPAIGCSMPIIRRGSLWR